MQKFTDFILELAHPPNPVRALDNSLTEAQQFAEDIYFSGVTTDFITDCNSCHVLDAERGLFGSGGESSSTSVQPFKVPQLRNAYQKVGMFGLNGGGVRRFLPTGSPDEAQIRGFGYSHSGVADSLDSFFSLAGFDFRAFQSREWPRNRIVQAVSDFVMVFPAELAPIVGQQVTIGSDPTGEQLLRLDLLESRAASKFVMKDNPGATECDLVAKRFRFGRHFGFLYNPETGKYETEFGGAYERSREDLLAKPRYGSEFVTFTCVPPGSGVRIAFDRDGDGVRNRIDRCPTGDVKTITRSFRFYRWQHRFGGNSDNPPPRPGC